MGMMRDGGVGGAARTKCFPAGWNAAAKRCDYCKSAAALIFCTTESAFMCMTCDAKVHNVATSSRHELVWMCEVCEQAPASFSCKADAAALCVACDRNIHSANPLARRHERAPVVPFYDTAESLMKSTAAATLLLPINHLSCTETEMENVTGHLISSNPITAKLSADAPDMKSLELLISNSDQFLDFEYPISADSVVPVQTLKPAVPTQLITDYSSENPFEIDFTKFNMNSYNRSYTITTPSFSHSVSSSSLDVGVVPDGSSHSDISYPFTRNTSTRGNEASQMVGIDREARVLRYKEKRKKRKFDKTIRYASRKAYAETRPRIKGRFAKRTEVQSDTDRLIYSSFSANFIADGGGFGARVIVTFYLSSKMCPKIVLVNDEIESYRA
ncbi:Zinc finger protein CONSTANS-LIKE 5 [Forsythia ovata]|uniref:Zinc finger protein CONSTANS-LIKE 5 n=1 Tax=Forsythia ovata TaxID=205694 RepID=A0ABD1PKG0_9LAMI